jgi:hypothetical protein
MAFIVPQQKLDLLKTKEHPDERRRERSPLSDKMIRLVVRHLAGMDASIPRDYTFERYKTDDPSATAGLDIFDGTGKLVFQGKELYSGIAGYWRPSRRSIAPASALNERDWGASAHRTSPARVS